MRTDAADKRAQARRGARIAGPRMPCPSQRLVSELAKCHFAVRPVFLDLDPQLEVYGTLPQIVQLDARQAPDLLEPLAPLADHDRLLSGALDPDDGIDHDTAAFVRKALYLHVEAVGQ